MTNQSIAALVAPLLALESLPEQQAYLADRGYWSNAGLGDLISHAQAELQPNADLAGALLTRLVALGDFGRFGPAAATAQWWLARQQANAGAFDIAAQSLASARLRYDLLGDTQMALRTVVGQLAILGELGRLNEAIALADSTLDKLSTSAADPQNDLIKALILQNRGMCQGHAGQFEAALDDYDAASLLYDKLDEHERHGDILKNQGVIRLGLGQAAQALDLFEQAARIVDESTLPMRDGLTLTNIGYAQMLLGRYSESLQALGRATERFSAAGFDTYAGLAVTDSAEVHLTLGNLDEARHQFTQAITIFSDADMAFYLSKAQFGLGTTHAAQGRFSAARQLLGEALVGATEIENNALQAAIMIELADVMAANDRTLAARTLLDDALALTETQTLPIQRCFAALKQFDFALAADELEAAANALHIAAAAAPQLPHIAYRLAYRRGRLAAAQGASEQAERHFRTAIAAIEQTRGQLTQEALRVAFMGDKQALYESLMQLLVDQNRLLEALAVAEQAKSRALVDMMERVLDTPQLSDSIESAETIQQMREALNALYNQLLSDEGNRRVSTAGVSYATIEAEAQALEQQLQRLVAQLELSDSADVTFGSDTLLSQLPPDVTCIEFHTIAQNIVAFVYTRETLQTAVTLAPLATLRKLVSQWQVHLRRFRSGGAFVQRNAARLEATANKLLGRLYTELIRPIEQALPDDGHTLLIVPHRDLYAVPFHALYDGQRYLIDRFAIGYAPSLTVFAHAQDRRAQNDRVSVFGVSDPSLPAVIQESQQVAARVDHADVFLDEAATLGAFAAHCDASVLHIATHGIHRAENPSFSGFRLNDGWVSAEDVLRMRFAQSLVLVSACESGRSFVTRGDEPIGLPRAFLAAGARAAIVTLWLVQDDVSAEMMPRFYTAMQQGSSVHQSLRAMQLAIKQAHPHPYYWAPYVLFGAL